MSLGGAVLLFTGGDPFTAAEAEFWVGRVNATLVNLGFLITTGYQRRAWVALGYESWGEMCEAEVTVPQLSRDQRRELVAALRSEGLSTRAIGDAIGASKDTVRNDLSSTGEKSPVEPDEIVGTNGKTYKPKPKPKPPRQPEQQPPELSDEEWLAREHDRAIDRNVGRLQKFLSGWITFSRLASHPDRDEILARLVEPDRRQLEAIAEELQWKI
jgi:hypothetical protein